MSDVREYGDALLLTSDMKVIILFELCLVSSLQSSSRTWLSTAPFPDHHHFTTSKFRSGILFSGRREGARSKVEIRDSAVPQSRPNYLESLKGWLGDQSINGSEWRGRSPAISHNTSTPPSTNPCEGVYWDSVSKTWAVRLKEGSKYSTLGKANSISEAKRIYDEHQAKLRARINSADTVDRKGGVTWVPRTKKWSVSLYLGPKLADLGSYDDEDAALATYRDHISLLGEHNGVPSLRMDNGFRNVVWVPSRSLWKAQTRLHGAVIEIGMFSAKEDAVAAWKAAITQSPAKSATPPKDKIPAAFQFSEQLREAQQLLLGSVQHNASKIQHTVDARKEVHGSAKKGVKDSTEAERHASLLARDLQLGKDIKEARRLTDVLSRLKRLKRGTPPSALEWAESAGLDSLDEIQRRIEAGTKAREMLVSAHRFMVSRHINRYYGYIKKLTARSGSGANEYADYVQEGMIGLTRAAEKYDPDMGISFYFYADRWIRSCVREAASEKRSYVHIPRNVQRVGDRIKKIRASQTESGDEVKTQDLVNQLGVPEVLVRRALDSATIRFESYDGWDVLRTRSSGVERDHHDEDTSINLDMHFGRALEDDHAGENMREELYRYVTNFSSNDERTIIAFRYGLRDGKPRSFEEISSLTGFSVRQAESLCNTALKRMRAEAGSNAEPSAQFPPSSVVRDEVALQLTRRGPDGLLEDRPGTLKRESVYALFR